MVSDVHAMTLRGERMHLRGAHSLAAASVLGLLLLLLGFPASALAAGGQLDSSFGGDGKVTTHFAAGSNGEAAAVAIQDDGKIVTAGGSYIPDTSASQFALARYNSDGSLDSSFGGDGKVRTNFGGDSDARASAVAIQADGKIVAVGISFVGDQRFALARYNSDGSLDPSFGGDGKVITHFAEGSIDTAAAVAIQADGRIVAAGATFIPAGVSTSRFALARYDTDGTLDGSFGDDGKVTSQFAGESYALGVAIQADGKIVAAGTSIVSHRRFALARYDTDGTLDGTFGGDGTGKIRTRFANGSGDGALAVAIQSDQRILAVGSSRGASHVRFALARYDTDGTLDASFGEDGSGKIRTHFADGTDDGASAVAIQANGKIVAAGYSRGASHRRFALARYLAA
jgi:uncharacterized delta-60 repeat protein